jgi:hypothetical protein
VPKLVHHYEIRHGESRDLVTTATSTQVLLRPDGQLVLNFPKFFEEMRERWQSGQIKPANKPSPTPSVDSEPDYSVSGRPNMRSFSASWWQPMQFWIFPAVSRRPSVSNTA